MLHKEIATCSSAKFISDSAVFDAVLPSSAFKWFAGPFHLSARASFQEWKRAKVQSQKRMRKVEMWCWFLASSI